MKKSLFLIVLSAIFLLLIAFVNAISFPAKGASNWATSQEYGLEKWLSVTHTENGTLKTGLNVSLDEVNVSKNLIVFGNIFAEIPNSFKNSNFSSLYNNEANARFKVENFTSAYDSRTDRWQSANFTSALQLRLNEFWNLANFTNALQNRLSELYTKTNFTNDYDNRADRYGKTNFTSQYDGREDRFGNSNFTSLFPVSYSAEYSSSGYKKANITGDFPNIDTSLLDDWALSNFTLAYDSRSDRFGLGNYSAEYSTSGYKKANVTTDYPNLDLSLLDDYSLSNFTANYESQAYWRDANQTAREGAYFKYSNFTAPQSINISHVACWKDATTLGNCGDTPVNNGVCTCI